MVKNDNIERFAIITGEHCCFGNYDKDDAECEICYAMFDCEDHT